MICVTASDLSLLDSFEQLVPSEISVSLLAEIERELLRLRLELSPAEWERFCHAFPKRRLFETLRRGKLTQSRLSDSRCPGDLLGTAATEATGANVPAAANIIDAWEYSLPACRSIRARIKYFSREIAEVIRTAIKPRVLVLGGGLHEAEDAMQSAHLHHLQLVALQQQLSSRQPHDGLRLESGDWSRLSRLQPYLGAFDLIYSPAWLDVTDDAQSALWLGTSVEMLRAGGTVGCREFCSWFSGRRLDGSMLELASLLPFRRTSGQPDH